jgi:hypothetical protein
LIVSECKITAQKISSTLIYENSDMYHINKNLIKKEINKNSIFLLDLFAPLKGKAVIRYSVVYIMLNLLRCNIERQIFLSIDDSADLISDSIDLKQLRGDELIRKGRDIVVDIDVDSGYNVVNSNHNSVQNYDNNNCNCDNNNHDDNDDTDNSHDKSIQNGDSNNDNDGNNGYFKNGHYCDNDKSRDNERTTDIIEKDSAIINTVYIYNSSGLEPLGTMASKSGREPTREDILQTIPVDNSNDDSDISDRNVDNNDISSEDNHANNISLISALNVGNNSTKEMNELNSINNISNTNISLKTNIDTNMNRTMNTNIKALKYNGREPIPPWANLDELKALFPLLLLSPSYIPNTLWICHRDGNSIHELIR